MILPSSELRSVGSEVAVNVGDGVGSDEVGSDVGSDEVGSDVLGSGASDSVGAGDVVRLSDGVGRVMLPEGRGSGDEPSLQPAITTEHSAAMTAIAPKRRALIPRPLDPVAARRSESRSLSAAEAVDITLPG
jgi:hypothetical protein